MEKSELRKEEGADVVMENLFVPGRLCLFGEHSDWAGLNRLYNGKIEKGMAIVSGIEQGIYAEVEKNIDFEVVSELSQGERYYKQKMNVEELRKDAEKGEYFSYMAGTASYMKEHYCIGGVKITLKQMDLPMKRGLSSSAAICVLVVKAFSKIYQLNLSTLDIMQAAYQGEQRTPSRCGRLDQACAFGTKLVLMCFDGMDIEVKRLLVRGDFYWVFANLNASKDTIRILADLGKCYPFAEDEKEKNVQFALGKKNQEIVQKAIVYFEQGDAQAMGELMQEAQKVFDEYIAPACPEQLIAPVLHSVLNDPVVKKLVYGAKGVGSQGDGTVQFLAKDREAQGKLIKYLREERRMDAYSFTIQQQRCVRKAIIPVAGFGTRVYPETRSIKKEFFPVIDQDGMLKPVILVLLEELDRADIEKICLVIGEEERNYYRNYFESSLAEEHYQKLPQYMREYEEKILRIGKKLEYVVQTERKGLGHAVYQCREFAGGEPVLLLLGDTIYQSNEVRSCTEQLLDAFEASGKLTVGLMDIPLKEVEHYGILYGKWEDKGERVMEVGSMIEKPCIEQAMESCGVKMKNGTIHYYMVFGNYILVSEVFDKLGENIKNGYMSHGEFQLTDALEEVRKSYGMAGYRIDGQAFDVGTPLAYRNTMQKFGLCGESILEGEKSL